MQRQMLKSEGNRIVGVDSDLAVVLSEVSS
jgi:hypothetical protein